MDQGAFLELDGIASKYGSTSVLSDINLRIERGEFVALLGSSGCGKTTLLRVLAGFVNPSAGRVVVRHRDVTGLAPDKRGMALVFQSYALWPHMTVDQNIGYGLKLKGVSKAGIAEKVAAMETLLGLQGLGARKPIALSGGQRQRVALGRALAVDPEILLLDEPLSNLDARIRLTVRHELRVLQKRLGITAIHVTHDREEAMVLADRIIILDAGRIAQNGTPEQVYNQPASAFVAAFMGAENSLPLSDGEVEARFRPEAARLSSITEPCPDDGIRFRGTVATATYPGGYWRHSVRVGEHEILADGHRAFEPGEEVIVHVAPQALFLFPSRDRPKPADHQQ
ncbi:ABC transporter ATP-binding protein [Rhizobium rhizogenes]|uniref:ABC transporter ATP-binding protein n=1 Tax=Rhizobium rhizogenes TaxID=359 RepID=UPI0022720A9C|nr:ABC transporter ATP-binding protein [Rhizobium rhizogenes]